MADSVNYIEHVFKQQISITKIESRVYFISEFQF